MMRRRGFSTRLAWGSRPSALRDRGAFMKSRVHAEAVVFRRSNAGARVRVLATGEVIAVRASNLWHVMPGHVVTVDVRLRGRVGGLLVGEGVVSNPRVDVPALGLPPLKVLERGAIRIASAPVEVKAYVMEQVPPLVGSDSDPICDAAHRKRHGDMRGAIGLLQDVLGEDLRCLDAHAHLGNWAFPTLPAHALLHYEIGVAIGDHALGPAFTGALLWSLLDNRPFLRCLHGQGLALWRLGRLEEAAQVFERLLRLSPTDELNAERKRTEVLAGTAWDEGEASHSIDTGA